VSQSRRSLLQLSKKLSQRPWSSRLRRRVA
jgi:hypothetical protein